MLATLRWANLLLSFLLELCLLAAVAYWGFSTQSGPLLQFVLGIGAPLLVAVVWGLLLAPKAPVHLQPATHALLAALLFALGALALLAAGQPWLALALAGLYTINRALAFVWSQ